MRRPRPFILLLTVLAVASLGAAASDGTPSSSATPTAEEPPASARTAVRLLEAIVTDPAGTATRATLGELHLESRRDGAPWAGIELVGAAVAGESAAERRVTTDDGSDEHAGDLSLGLPSTAGASADLQLLEYLVRAEGREATSRLAALDGRLDLAPLGLRVDDGGRTLATSVGDASSATTTLALGGVALTLGDLLPPGLVDDLPLGVVLELLQRLPVSVPTVADLVTLVERLLADLTALVDAATALEQARAELRQLVAEAPGVADAEDAVAAAEQTLAEARASLQEALAERDDARTTLAEAEELLAEVLDDTSDDDTIEDVTDDVTDAVDDVTDTATEPVDEVTDDTTDAVDGATDTATEPVDDLTEPVDDLTGGGTEPADDTIGGLGGALLPAAVFATVAVDVEDAEAAVAEAETALAAAEQVVGNAHTAVGAAEQAVTSATARLDELVEEATGALGDATGPREDVERLRDRVRVLLDRIAEVTLELPDLSVLLDELRGGLADVPVVSLDGLWLDVALDADTERGRAEVTCLLGSITVFGETVTDPRCGAASDLLATVPARMADLLAALPLAEPPTPRIAGLAVTTDASPEPVDGVTWATADVTGLDLEVPSVALQGEPDRLTTRLDELVAQALAAADALTGSVLGASVTPTLDSVVSLLERLGGQLDVLPTGAELADRRTLGIDVTVGRLAAEVLHGAAAETPLEIGTPFSAVPALATTSPVPAGGGGAWDPCYVLALLSLGLVGGMWRQRRRLAELA